MAKLSRLAALAGHHLRQHRPKLYRELQQSGRLQAFLQERGKAASDLLGSLVEQGRSWDQAWEVAKDEIYLPTEADVPKLVPPPLSRHRRRLTDPPGRPASLFLTDRLWTAAP
jgi:hypothetical protein